MGDARSSIDHHLRSITERDLTSYSATVHDDVTVILPNGHRLAGRQPVEEFHRDWFADTDWTQVMTEVSATIDGETAIAVYEAHYRDVTEDGSPIDTRFLVTFVFVHTGNAWLLLHDQCTPLQ